MTESAEKPRPRKKRAVIVELYRRSAVGRIERIESSPAVVMVYSGGRRGGSLRRATSSR